MRTLPRKDAAVTGSPDGLLKDKTVLVVGRGSGLARAIALAVVDAGARVVAAGRDQETLRPAYAGEPGVSTEIVDLTDEASIAALGERLGTVDHVVCTASARVRGRLADLDRDAIRLSFDTKVIGPLMLARHLAPRMSRGGSFVLFSGVAAAKITVGTMGVAITNAAADTLARSLALELAPLRVNAISPGVIDTGAWDALGEQGKADYFAGLSARNPARRIGTADDIAQGVLFALTSTFLTGQTLHIDGGEPLT
jgi:NAD(P)-dependent dehydrogenase (short-subunit alcohol dehydrogenase family)